MTPERWQHVDRVWHAVLLRPEAERAHALVELCGADEELRREVESLLQSLDRASAAGFGASPGVMLHAMPLAGRQVGHYAVTELLGVGGMGEVYRAHDSTLGRDVALKVLSHSWLADSDARMRFEREARILASLNHPNIAAIHGIEEDARPLGGEPPVRALVLELVEGETLADRLARESGALPVDEAVIIALQVADALEAAHARGIVHRDLKPSNIKITPEGNVKVLDFGLARVISGEGQGSGPAGSPTVTLGSTDASLPLGTARYMSPEQIRGREVDRRADIWAFGCVLYEMMTGTPAFPGDDVADLLAEVVEGEPEWTALPPATPPNVRLCLQCCLQKAPRQRFHDIGDVRLALTGAFSSQLGESDAPGKTSRLASVGWAMSLLAVAAAAVFVTLFARPPEAPETRLEIVTPPVYEPLAIDISPDGRTVAFQANDSGLPRLWIRRLDASDAEPLAGTDFATMPFWSPDGRSIGYFSGVELKRIDLEERFVRTLAPAPHARGGTWNRDGTIVFGAVAMGPLHSTPAGGGTVTQVTSLLPGQTSHRWPQFLPDGRRFLLTALGTPEVRGLYVGSLDDRTVRRVSDRDSAFAFMPPDILLVGRNGGLMARRLSDDLTVVNTEPVPVAPKLFVSPQLTGIGRCVPPLPDTSSIVRRRRGRSSCGWIAAEGRSLPSVRPTTRGWRSRACRPTDAPWPCSGWSMATAMCG